MEQNVHRTVRERLQTQQDPEENVKDFPFVLNDIGSNVVYKKKNTMACLLY